MQIISPYEVCEDKSTPSAVKQLDTCLLPQLLDSMQATPQLSKLPIRVVNVGSNKYVNAIKDTSDEGSH